LTTKPDDLCKITHLGIILADLTNKISYNIKKTAFCRWGEKMTLIVSLRIPDGLVIAGDSLSSVQTKVGLIADIQSECPLCKGKIDLKEIKMPPFPIPATTSSFAQKLFSFGRKFGIGSFGTGILNKKTIYYHVKELEAIAADQENLNNLTLSNVKDLLLEHFDKEIKKEILDIDRAPDNFYPLGFQVVGYEDGIGTTIEINIGKKSRSQKITGIGCTVSGDGQLVVQMWELGKKDPRRGTNYERFSLQDAIDYAEFLITATAKYQRFTNVIPSVGGEVDIALVTPFGDFNWIRQKELARLLENFQKRG
jgi:hypothetical protein